MNKSLAVILILVLAAGSGGIRALAEETAEAPVYRFDPTLSIVSPRPPALTADPTVVIDKDAARTNVRLQTETPLAPYLGAERGSELSPEERRLLPEAQAGGGPTDYRLEAGVGLFVEDKASLNLGYRFHEQPSLLNERRTDPLSLSGDLRISFDLKLPF